MPGPEANPVAWTLALPLLIPQPATATEKREEGHSAIASGCGLSGGPCQVKRKDAPARTCADCLLMPDFWKCQVKE